MKTQFLNTFSAIEYFTTDTHEFLKQTASFLIGFVDGTIGGASTALSKWPEEKENIREKNERIISMFRTSLLRRVSKS